MPLLLVMLWVFMLEGTMFLAPGVAGLVVSVKRKKAGKTLPKAVTVVSVFGIVFGTAWILTVGTFFVLNVIDFVELLMG